MMKKATTVLAILVSSLFAVAVATPNEDNQEQHDSDTTNKGLVEDVLLEERYKFFGSGSKSSNSNLKPGQLTFSQQQAEIRREEKRQTAERRAYQKKVEAERKASRNELKANMRKKKPYGGGDPYAGQGFRRPGYFDDKMFDRS